jgi:hypothetical protein
VKSGNGYTAVDLFDCRDVVAVVESSDGLFSEADDTASVCLGKKYFPNEFEIKRFDIPRTSGQ